MEKKNRYVYPAILDYSDTSIAILFPDLPGCLPCADTDEEAIQNAHEAMGLHLWSMEEDGDEIPKPTRAIDIELEHKQVVVLVDVWMPPVRDKLNNKAINKTLTIPSWLNRKGMAEKVNFSQILQDALKEYLGISTLKK